MENQLLGDGKAIQREEWIGERCQDDEDSADLQYQESGAAGEGWISEDGRSDLKGKRGQPRRLLAGQLASLRRAG
jgi:hypothetical protein